MNMLGNGTWSPSHDVATHQELVRRLSLAPSRRWIASYLDLIKRVIEVAAFSPDDARLSLTMPNFRQKSPAVRVNVNNRWVLVNYTEEQGYRLGTIYGAEFEYQSYILNCIEHQWRFDPLLVEESVMSPTPYFLWIKPDVYPILPKEMEPGWLDAVLAEAHRARASVYRGHHQPVVYRAAVDIPYRKRVLNEAFPRG
jgi:hypothetical protein